MSDRLAVFNAGRIEQVGAPAEVYERPASEFIASFVGVSNTLERGGRRFTIRPEKVRLLDDGAREDGLHVEAGTIEDASYVGMVTRYEVALQDGGRLQVVRQNLEVTSAHAMEARGRTVQGRMARGPDLRHRNGRGGRMRALLAVMTVVLAFLVGACGGDDDERRQRFGGRQGARGPEGRDRDRRGRGRGQPDRVGRLRRGRLDRPEGRLGLGLRAADRLPGQRQGRQHVRRDGDADAHRPVRRRVGVWRRDAAPDRRRRRRPGQHRPDQELRGRVRGPQGQAAGTPSTARRTACRTAAARTC